MHCVSSLRGRTSLFVTLDTARYMNYKQVAAQTRNVSIDSAGVELVVTMIYTTYDMGNATIEHNESYALKVLTQ